MKLLAFAASNSSQSINHQLVSYAARLIDGADVELLRIDDYEMPLYSADREQANGIPQLAHQFYQTIGEADALLISFAEHNGSYSAAYKNLFDWTSRISMQVYQGKPTVMLSASPGRGGAANVLATATGSAAHFGFDLKASLSIPSFNHTFDPEANRLVDEELQAKLLQAVRLLAEGE